MIFSIFKILKSSNKNKNNIFTYKSSYLAILAFKSRLKIGPHTQVTTKSQSWGRIVGYL